MSTDNSRPPHGLQGEGGAVGLYRRPAERRTEGAAEAFLLHIAGGTRLPRLSATSGTTPHESQCRFLHSYVSVGAWGVGVCSREVLGGKGVGGTLGEGKKGLSRPRDGRHERNSHGAESRGNAAASFVHS